MKISKELKTLAQTKIIESSKIPTEKKISLIREIENISEISPGTAEALGTAAGVLTMGAIIAISVALQDRFFSYYAKKCFGLKDSNQRRICKRNAKLEAFKHEIELLEKMKRTHCPKTKNLNKCKVILDRRISNRKDEYSRLKGLEKGNKRDLLPKVHPAEYPD